MSGAPGEGAADTNHRVAHEDSRPRDVRDGAVFYTETLGWAVGTLHANSKAPVNGRDAWTKSAEEILAVLDRHPNRGIFANLAKSGLIEIDVDVRGEHDGHVELDQLEAVLGPLPATLRATSPSGGTKHFYRRPEGFEGRNRNLADHVELRVNGITVIPPSPYPAGGVYAWVDEHAPSEVELAELPGAWREHQRQAEERQNGYKRFQLGDDKLREPHRRITLLRYAGALVKTGVTGDLLDLSVHLANDKLCEPRLDEKEIDEQILKSAHEWPAGELPRVLTFSDNNKDEHDEAVLGVVPTYPTDSLPEVLRRFVQEAADAGLPAGLTAGAAVAALAAAVGPLAQLEVRAGWRERPILWVPLIAPRGAGKSPAQTLAFAPLRAHDAALEEDDGGVLLGDQTLEALARELHATNGAGAVDLDELVVLLRGLGEYKRGGGSDRGRMLALWSGAPWAFTRVGAGKKGGNAVRLHVPRPTLVICGGLQTVLHDLLGSDDDGLRPRWLVHLAEMPTEEATLAGIDGHAWKDLIELLLNARAEERTWQFGASAERAFVHHRNRLKRQARTGHEPASVTAALIKADIHVARIALVLAEAEHPGASTGTGIDADIIDRAAQIVDFTINCWRALPEQGALALSYRDKILDGAINRLVAWLEHHGGQATRRDLQRAGVAGVRTARDFKELLRRYEETFPGTVIEEHSDHGGPSTVTVSAPRRGVIPTVGSSDSEKYTPENSRSRAKSGAVGSSNSAPSDSAASDTAARAIRPRPGGPLDPKTRSRNAT